MLVLLHLILFLLLRLLLRRFCFYEQMQQQLEFRAKVIATTFETVLASSCRLAAGCLLTLPAQPLLLLLLPFFALCYYSPVLQHAELRAKSVDALPRLQCPQLVGGGVIGGRR